jgi:xanthine dehydrogenase accessory factor
MTVVGEWLAADAGPAILVTVAAAEGSVPREPGTHMVVDAGRQWGTIGGGHLELHAAHVARAMLQEASPARRLERCPLGPGLGQCCGGVVHLAFEVADRAHLALLAAHADRDCWRAVALDGAPELALFDDRGGYLGGARATATPAFAFEGGTRVLQAPDGRRWLLDLVPAPRAHLMLFGAHDGGAARHQVRAMADLPCRITWVDERADLFPAQVPEHVVVEATDTPEALAAAAPPGTAFLVMTHSHALDQRLVEAILRRPAGADWLGLIGSQTKRRQFEHRLRDRGIPASRLATMVCPIGLAGIGGKEPASIAIAVAAQLLMLWEQRHTPVPPQSGTD